MEIKEIKHVGEQALSYLIEKCKATFALITHTHTASEVGADSSGSASAALALAEQYTDEQIAETNEKYDEVSDTITDLSNTVSTNYDESIIGLSIDGQVITYIKGDGSVHTMVTQDTNTEYFLATDEVTGLTKLYATIGSAEDGTMTQKAIKTELDKKVGVTVDASQDTLIFTI